MSAPLPGYLFPHFYRGPRESSKFADLLQPLSSVADSEALLLQEQNLKQTASLLVTSLNTQIQALQALRVQILWRIQP